MFEPNNNQKITPPPTATKFALDKYVQGDDGQFDWFTHTPEGWEDRYVLDGDWPVEDEDWVEHVELFDGVEPGIYRFRWAEDDARRALRKSPVIRIGRDAEGTTSVEVGRVKAKGREQIERARDARDAALTRPDPDVLPPASFVLHGAQKPATPPQDRQDEDVRLATVKPVHAPRIDHRMADNALQSFTLVYGLVSQQTDKMIAANQEMMRSLLSSVTATEQARSQVALATQREQLTAGGGITRDDVAAIVAETLRPMIEDLQSFDASDGPPDVTTALNQIAQAADQQPKSALEQIVAFMNSPAGGIVAGLLQRAFPAAIPGAPPAGGGYTPPEGNIE